MPLQPTPIYRVQFDGNYLPGFLQQEDIPFEFRVRSGESINQMGGSIGNNGAAIRNVKLSMRLISRLDTATGLQHLEDCKDQWREGLRYVARLNILAPLFVGDTDRYVQAMFRRSGMPLSAGSSTQRTTYDIDFLIKPFFIDTTILTDSVSGNGSLDVTFTDTAKTYPTFVIASGVTAATFTAPDSRTLTFTRGSVTGAVTVDCGRLTALQADGTTAIQTIDEIDWGFSHIGSGTFTVTVSGYAGSGSITMNMQARYER